MTVLIVAAHPDDEILGVGGVIARHVDDGEPVHILILAEGATARSDTATPKSHKATIEVLQGSGYESEHVTDRLGSVRRIIMVGQVFDNLGIRAYNN